MNHYNKYCSKTTRTNENHVKKFNRIPDYSKFKNHKENIDKKP